MKPVALPAAVLVLAFLAGCVASKPNEPTQAPNKVSNKDLEQAAIYNTQLAVDALRKNNLQEAKDKITRALDQDARNAEVQAAAGLIYERLGEDRVADAHFSRALSLAPQNPSIQNNYAVYLCRKGNPDRGQKMFLEAAANPLYRTPEAAYVNAGTCARGAGNAEQAEQHFRKALGLNPRNAEALIQLADLELGAGNLLPARAFLERYLALTPATAQSLWLGVRLERAMGNPQAAMTYGNRLKSQFPTSVETSQLLESERTSR
jgi:type IV pilus assembly protein PilF